MKTLSDYVTEYLEGRGDINAAEAAEALVDIIPPSVMRKHMVSFLAQFIRSHIASGRNNLIPTQASAPALELVGVGAAESAKPRKVRRVPTKMLDASQEYFAFLQERILVPSGQYRLIAECTVEDLKFAAGQRRIDAEDILARADYYDALAEALQESGKVTVKDLPAEVLHKFS